MAQLIPFGATGMDAGYKHEGQMLRAWLPTQCRCQMATRDWSVAAAQDSEQPGGTLLGMNRMCCCWGEGP